MGLVDEAGEVRAGEALDVEALQGWLAREVPGLAGPVEVLQFPKGHSNLTYLLRVAGREVVLRRPPFGAKIKSAHDMGREFALLSGLRQVWDKVPEPLAYCEDEGVLGAPFYLMERLSGLIIRKRMPPGVEAGPEAMRALCEAMVGTLAEIHAVDWRAAGLEGLWRGQGYVRRQVEGWTDRYVRAKTDEIPEIEQVAAWLAANLPEEGAPALIHNDFKHDNLVLDPAVRGRASWRVVGVLDWEMATVGDPLMDLGTTLAYWVEATDPAPVRSFAFCPTDVPGSYTRAELVRRYEEVSGREVKDPVFYFAYGLFKLAVVAQQIYRRFKQGHSKDARFASFILGVRILGGLGARAIEKGRIDRLG